MSIELSVSGEKCGDPEMKARIMAILAAKRIDSCVSDTESTVNYESVHTIEPGFRISLYKLETNRFVDKVWSWLRPLLDLECAHVCTSSYLGCVLNWPGVLTESKCRTRCDISSVPGYLYPPG